MKLRRLLQNFSSIISDNSLFQFARILPNSFTREDGKMPLHTLLFYLIFRHGETVSEDICRIYPDIGSMSPPSKQAVFKRMSILNYDVWHAIQRLFLDRIYRKMEKKTRKGYLLIAVDGTFATLPNHPVLGLIFGKHSPSEREEIIKRTSPQAKISVAYDVLNKVILDFQIAHKDTSEIPLLFRHLEVLEDVLKDYKVIILVDRYYGSAEFFKYCEMKGYKYICRAKSNFFKKERALIPPDCLDSTLNILIDKVWQKRIIREIIRRFISIYPVMHVRLLKGHYEYDQEYIKFDGKKVITHHSVDAEYFTNLSLKEFSREEVIRLYHVERWKIECGYDSLKNILDIEQLNSANPIIVINEIMAKIIFFNIENLVWQAAQEEAASDEKHLTNNKHVVELCQSSWFVCSFFNNRFDSKRLTELVIECARVKILVREGRHYRRWDKFRPSLAQPRHRTDGRKNPPLKKTKTGFATTNH